MPDILPFNPTAFVVFPFDDPVAGADDTTARILAARDRATRCAGQIAVAEFLQGQLVRFGADLDAGFYRPAEAAAVQRFLADCADSLCRDVQASH